MIQIILNPKRQSHKMAKHTQTIRRQIADELFGCVWRFCEIGAWRVKERTANVGSYIFLQEMLINIKTRHFHSSINHREQVFHRTLTAGYFRPANIAKFLRTGFFIEHL